MIGTATLLALLMLTLTGCFHLDRGVQLNSDGSGKYTLTIGFSDELLALDTTGQLKKGFDQCGAQLKAGGSTYRTYEDNDYTYWSFARDFKSVKELNDLLNNKASGGLQSCNFGNSDTTSPITSSAPTDTFKVTQQPGFLGDTFHVTGHISLASQTGTTDTTGSQALLAGIRETFSVTMPNGVSAHRGGSVSGSTVTYTIHLNESADIDVTGGGTNIAAVAGIGGGALVVIGGAIAALLLLRRRNATPAQAQPAPVAVGGDAMPGDTQPGL
jgi:hypothetical protein